MRTYMLDAFLERQDYPGILILAGGSELNDQL